MKQSINEYDFRRAFESLRPDNFSYAGLGALFEFMEEMEEATSDEIELDVLAICCDYSEMTLDEIINDYIYSKSCGNEHIYDAEAWEELKELDDDERLEYLTDWLNDRTIVIPVDDETLIVGAF